MEKTPFILVVIIAVIALVASNQGFRKSNPRDGCEISSYEYAQLHQAVAHHEEIATAARMELTQDYVSIAQYNRIMHQVDKAKRRQARQMAAMQRTAAR